MRVSIKDYKDWIQERADDLAVEYYSMDFYTLAKEEQQEIYALALEDYKDEYASYCDYVYEMHRDKEVGL